MNRGFIDGLISRGFFTMPSDLMGKNPNDKFQKITSYHEAKLAQVMPCDNCGVILKKRATVIVGETPTGTRYFFCEKCRQI